MGLLIDSRQVQPESEAFKGVGVMPLMNGNTGTEAVTMTLLSLKPGAILPAHTHDCEEAFFVLEGDGVAMVNGVEHPIRAGTALLASVGDSHGLANRSDARLQVLCMLPAAEAESKFLPE